LKRLNKAIILSTFESALQANSKQMEVYTS